MTTRQPALAMLLLSLVAIIWGGSFIAARVALRELSPIALATIRFLLAAAMFIPLLVASPRYRAPWRSIPRLAGFGLLSVTFYFIFQYNGVARTSASLSAIVIALSPLATILMSWTFLHERLDRWQSLGVLLATAGAVVLVTRGAVEVGGAGYWLGILYLFLNVLAWGLYNILGKRALESQHPMTLTAYMTILGALCLVPFAIADGGLTSVASLSSSTWLAIGYLVVLCSVFAYAAYNYALRSLPASQAGVFQFLNPVAASLLAGILLGEPLTLITAIGGGMAIAGVYLANRTGAAPHLAPE
jgi:drug/metabolite transporter (DMT)-like permease